MKRTAFTLVELLVVIAIIGILVALLLPAVNAAREAARRTTCKNNMRQLALACNSYAEVNKAFPHGAKQSNTLSWVTYILPYIEQRPVFDELTANDAFKDGMTFNGGPTNNEGTGKALLTSTKYQIGTLLCPSTSIPRSTKSSSKLTDQREGYANHYLGIAGARDTNPVTAAPYPFIHPGTRDGYATKGMLMVSGTFVNNAVSPGVTVKVDPVRIKGITDGVSKTLLIGEACSESVMGAGVAASNNLFDAWVIGVFSAYGASCRNVYYALNSPYPADPTDPNRANNLPLCSNHPGGAHATMVDGAAFFLSDDMNLVTLRAAASRNGKESSAIQ